MPITTSKFKCLECEDVFDVTSENFSKCKCGKTEVQAGRFSYSYKNGTRAELIESETYHFENEFYKLSEKAIAILEEIDKIKKETDYKYYIYKYYETGKNGEKFLESLNFEYSASDGDFYVGEHNAIKLSVKLKKDDYFSDSDQEEVEKKLGRFLNIMRESEAGTFNISDRSFLYDMAEKEDLETREEATGSTNFNLYI